jgi:hypothetical protein
LDDPELTETVISSDVFAMQVVVNDEVDGFQYWTLEIVGL